MKGREIATATATTATSTTKTKTKTRKMYIKRKESAIHWRDARFQMRSKKVI